MFRIELTRAALRALRGLSRADRRRIDAAIVALEIDPHPAGSRKLQGQEDLYRVRVGDYRIVYQVEGIELLVLVIRIGHRREVYRGL